MLLSLVCIVTIVYMEDRNTEFLSSEVTRAHLFAEQKIFKTCVTWMLYAALTFIATVKFSIMLDIFSTELFPSHLKISSVGFINLLSFSILPGASDFMVGLEHSLGFVLGALILCLIIQSLKPF